MHLSAALISRILLLVIIAPISLFLFSSFSSFPVSSLPLLLLLLPSSTLSSPPLSTIYPPFSTLNSPHILSLTFSLPPRLSHLVSLSSYSLFHPRLSPPIPPLILVSLTQLEAAAAQPFSAPSLKSLRLGTMFPSIEGLNKDKNKKREEEEGDLFTVANAVKSRGGLSDPYEMNVDQEVRVIGCEPLIECFR